MPTSTYAELQVFRLSVVVLFLFSANVFALDIDLSFSGGFENRPAAVAAMNQAAAWELMLSDPITVEIEVREASVFELPFGADGGTFPTWYEETYTLIRRALLDDATSPDDAIAAGHLQLGPRLSFQAWDAEQQVVNNHGDDWISNWVLLPRANLKALGIAIEEGDTDPDAEILWNSVSLDFFDYDRRDGIDGRDFVGVVTTFSRHMPTYRYQ